MYSSGFINAITVIKNVFVHKDKKKSEVNLFLYQGS